MNGTPQITNLEQAKAYNDAYNSLNTNTIKSHLDNIDLGVLWCQTGGWGNLIGDGSAECCRTALATLASINSNSVVTPNDTAIAAGSVIINDKQYLMTKPIFYSVDNNGYNNYNFKSQSEMLDAINSELDSGRAVEVHTIKKNGGEHWVTVTGTIDGNEAESFSDLKGIDPWYNGANDKYYDQNTTASGAKRPDLSGVIQLSSSNNKDFNPDYTIKTVSVD